jgi:hypothetical protein
MVRLPPFMEFIMSPTTVVGNRRHQQYHHRHHHQYHHGTHIEEEGDFC